MSEHSKLAVVQAIERNHDENGPVVEVIVDTGGGTLLTLEHFDGAGEDSLPLPGDLVALDESTGQGAARAIGYADPKNAGSALPGEKRSYVRDENGEIAAEMWLKRPGLISVRAIKAGANIELSTEQSGGVINLNGVTIDANGNISAPGEVTAMAAIAPVSLSTHLHTSGGAGSPTSPPTPGT